MKLGLLLLSTCRAPPLPHQTPALSTALLSPGQCTRNSTYHVSAYTPVWEETRAAFNTQTCPHTHAHTHGCAYNSHTHIHVPMHTHVPSVPTLSHVPTLNTHTHVPTHTRIHTQQRKGSDRWTPHTAPEAKGCRSSVGLTASAGDPRMGPGCAWTSGFLDSQALVLCPWKGDVGLM